MKLSPTSSKIVLIVLMIASIIFWSIVILGIQDETSTVELTYTDHMRHETTAWLFLSVGLAVFYVPLGELVKQIKVPFPHVPWPDLPHGYPPGSLLIFLPFSLLSNLGILPDRLVHELMIFLFMLVAHIIIYDLCTWIFPRLPKFVSPLVVFLFYILLIHWSLNGFFDVIPVLLLCRAAKAYARRNHRKALVLSSAAFFMHYRALMYAPLIIWSLFLVLRDIYSRKKTKSKSSVVALGVSIPLLALSLITAYLSFVVFPYAQVIYRMVLDLGLPRNPLYFRFLVYEVMIKVCIIVAITAFLLRRNLGLVFHIVTIPIVLSLYPMYNAWYALFMIPLLMMTIDRKEGIIIVAYIMLLTYILQRFPVCEWYWINYVPKHLSSFVGSFS